MFQSQWNNCWNLWTTFDMLKKDITLYSVTRSGNITTHNNWNSLYKKSWVNIICICFYLCCCTVRSKLSEDNMWGNLYNHVFAFICFFPLNWILILKKREWHTMFVVVFSHVVVLPCLAVISIYLNAFKQDLFLDWWTFTAVSENKST